MLDIRLDQCVTDHDEVDRILRDTNLLPVAWTVDVLRSSHPRVGLMTRVVVLAPHELPARVLHMEPVLVHQADSSRWIQARSPNPEEMSTPVTAITAPSA